MSTITFICDTAKKDTVKNGVWNILKNHYYTTVFPESDKKYKNEGKAIYMARMETLMQEELCSVEDTKSGFIFNFDSTENAGNSIVSEVYGVSGGYDDNGLTAIIPVFREIVKQFPFVIFDAFAECNDQWLSQEYDVTYDGKVMKINSIELDIMLKVFEMIEDEDLETISEETGLSVEELEEIEELFF